jgi:hypothetical protein
MHFQLPIFNITFTIRDHCNFTSLNSLISNDDCYEGHRSFFNNFQSNFCTSGCKRLAKTPTTKPSAL